MRVFGRIGSYYLRVLDANGGLGFYPVSTASPVTTGDGALVSGAWRHIAVSFSGEGRKIYVNGVDSTVLAGDATLPPAINSTLILGGYSVSSGFFGGCLDDVRIYKRPLTAAEVLAIYAGGSGTEEVIVS